MVYVSVYRKKNRISYGKEQQVVKYTPKVPGSYIYTHTHRLPCGPVWSNMKHPNPRFSLEAPKETSDLGSAPWKFNTAR